VRCAWSRHAHGSCSLYGQVFEVSIRLEFKCTNNQAEYEGLLAGLEELVGKGVKHVEAFGDSKLIVQQVHDERQCLDGVLNSYRE
jgi:ribonuclease HI